MLDLLGGGVSVGGSREDGRLDAVATLHVMIFRGSDLGECKT